jgi:hypothetical protein
MCLRKKNLVESIHGGHKNETNRYSTHNTIIIREQGLTLQFYGFAKLGQLFIHLSLGGWDAKNRQTQSATQPLALISYI